METFFGWSGSILALFVSVPQFFDVRRTSKATYGILAAVHICYALAGTAGGNYWLTMSGTWGLIVCGVILWRLRDKEKLA